MRISDWSSDVCSSDLKHFSRPLRSERLAKAYADGARRVYPHRRGRVEHRAVVGNAFVNIGNIIHEQRDVEIAGTQAGMEIDRSVCLEWDGEEHAFDVREPLRLILGIAADKGPAAADDRPFQFVLDVE